MITVYPFENLGHADHGWLNARHHFSFARYVDRNRMGFGALRVVNDDRVSGQRGFTPHPHDNMEIITYVRSGAITHTDSMGHEGRTAAGDVQVMSAGTGVTHSEYNMEDETTTLFQIWIMPDMKGAKPNWGAKSFPKAAREARFEVLAGGRQGDAEAGALPINADAAVMAATLGAGQSLRFTLPAGRVAYLVAARGSATVNGQALGARDAAAILDEQEVEVVAGDKAELVMVEVAA